MAIAERAAAFLSNIQTSPLAAAAGNSVQQAKSFVRSAVPQQASQFLQQTGTAVGTQFNPTMQAAGAGIAGMSSRVLQKGANALADAGDAAFGQGNHPGLAAQPLLNASNLLHAGSTSLENLSPRQQTMLGYGALGAGTLAAGAAAAAISNVGKKKRMAGQNLGAQLGVAMPPQY
jgi:hypothetical protein